MPILGVLASAISGNLSLKPDILVIGGGGSGGFDGGGGGGVDGADEGQAFLHELLDVQRACAL